MKKSILICGLALLGLTSCKKTWTCDCTITTNGTVNKVTTSIPDQRKSDAKTICSDLATSANNNATNFAALGVTQNTVCEIK